MCFLRQIYEIFIDLLKQIKQKFLTLNTWENKIVAYSNMINNIKLNNWSFYIYYINNSEFLSAVCKSIQFIIIIGIFEYLFFTIISKQAFIF